MPGMVRQYGAELCLNHISGLALPVVASSPPSWFPGLIWIDSSSGYAVKTWNGSAWTSTGAGNRYLALLLADPDTSGSGGGPAVSVADLTEDTTSGYLRQPITFSQAVAGPPASLSNSGVITFGPYSAAMAAPAAWAAMVTSSTGTGGLLLYTWDLDEIQQAGVSQDIVVPAQSLSLVQE